MNDSVIQIDQVSFFYGDRRILNQVNLTITQGDFMAIIGPNGGGKTTLIKLMLGLITPDSGTVRILGQPTQKASGPTSTGYQTNSLFQTRSRYCPPSAGYF